MAPSMWTYKQEEILETSNTGTIKGSHKGECIAEQE